MNSRFRFRGQRVDNGELRYGWYAIEESLNDELEDATLVHHIIVKRPWGTEEYKSIKAGGINVVCITRHANQRVRQRVGIPNKAVKRYVEKAYRDGLTHGELSGGLKRYIDGVYLQKRSANDIRVYGEFVFLFQSARLITVTNLPNRYKRTAREQLRNKEGTDGG